MDRRTVLKGGFVLAATAHTTANVAVAADPLVHAINDYRAGNAAFCKLDESEWPALGGDDAVIEMTYGAPMRVLDEWDQPAKSLEGAISALKLIRDEQLMLETMGDSMLAAALSYLESLTI